MVLLAKAGFRWLEPPFTFSEGFSMSVKQLEMRIKQLKTKIETRQAELADLKSRQKELKDELAEAKQAEKAKAAK